LFLKASKMTKNEIINEYEKIIITKWKSWVTIIDSDSEIDIPAIETKKLVDATWAGDAFRWWLLKWLYNGLSWEVSAKIGCVCAHYCIQSYWNQNYKFNMDEFKNKYYEAYWEDLNI
jgi:adenosine kinase